MQRHKSILPGLTLGTLAALLLSAASAAAQSRSGLLTEEFHKVYPLTANGRVELRNINGAVRITAWDRNEVKVDAVKSAYRDERLKEVEIRVASAPDSISITTHYPEHNLTFHDDDADNPPRVDYTLTVPRAARLDEIKLVNGGLEIEGVRGEVRASSVNGRVTARGIHGVSRLSTVNGQLEAAFDRLEPANRAALNSVNGSVVITLPSDSNTEINASTVHGSIRNDFGLPVQHGRYVGHKLSGRLASGETRLDLKNVNGSISIRRADDGKTLSAVTNLLERDEMF